MSASACLRRQTYEFSEAAARRSEARQPLLQGTPHKPSATSEHATLLKLDELTGEACAPFDESCLTHTAVLESLWEVAFGADEPFQRRSARWCEIGFQQEDPVSDVRGAGFLGLCHLTQFVRGVGGVRDWEGDLRGFGSLAIASLNCTAMLLSYLGLNRTLMVPGGCARVTCSPEVQRAFLALTLRDPRALQAIHAGLLHHLVRVWADMQTPTTTMLDFPAALRATHQHMVHTLARMPRPWALADVVAELHWGDTSLGGLADGETGILTLLLLLLARRLGCCHAPE